LRCACASVTRRTGQSWAFGILTLDKRVDWSEGEAQWMKARVRLNVSPGEDESPEAALVVAKALWRQQADWHARIRANEESLT
jgi:hypothetical protein